MEVKLLLGNDECKVSEQKTLLLKASYTKLDAAEDYQDIKNSLTSFSLFGQTFLWVMNFEKLSTEQLKEMSRLGKKSDTVIIARASSLTSAQRSVFTSNKSTWEIIPCAFPKSKELPEYLNKTFKDLKIKIDADALKLLTERCGEDPARLSSILRQLKVLKTKVNIGMIRDLVGSSRTPGVPWDLSNALERGEYNKVLDLIPDTNYLAATAYLMNRYCAIAKIQEADNQITEETSDGVSATSIRRLARLAQTIPAAQIYEIILSLNKFDLEFKRSHPLIEYKFKETLLKICQIHRQDTK